MNTISATNARIKLYDILDDVDKLSKRIAITSHGKTKAVLINADELDSMEETMEILNDKRALKAIAQSEKDIKAGRIYPLEEVIKEL